MGEWYRGSRSDESSGARPGWGVMVHVQEPDGLRVPEGKSSEWVGNERENDRLTIESGGGSREGESRGQQRNRG